MVLEAVDECLSSEGIGFAPLYFLYFFHIFGGRFWSFLVGWLLVETVEDLRSLGVWGQLERK